MTTFDCDDCGRLIGQADSHVVLRDGSVTCMRHYKANLDAKRISTVLTREQATDALRPFVRRPRAPETL